jgi:hypothetical protein
VLAIWAMVIAAPDVRGAPESMALGRGDRHPVNRGLLFPLVLAGSTMNWVSSTMATTRRHRSSRTRRGEQASSQESDPRRAPRPNGSPAGAKRLVTAPRSLLLVPRPQILERHSSVAKRGGSPSSAVVSAVAQSPPDRGPPARTCSRSCAPTTSAWRAGALQRARAPTSV